MNTVSCDNCHKNFTIKPQEKKHGKGITETYFTCPHCDARYTAFVTNADIRKRQREIRQLHESVQQHVKDFADGRINEQDYKQTIGKINEKINKKKAELEPMMKEMKNKVAR
ncbi:hypothetical protein KHA93_02925 [Bacillus sp. FJAT-49732]|uniref:Uncharacterized protein n=1 Tax=Lederbergia citrisecunda TaxID=2833583 RepID=A0A942TKW6_9BACI|nr:hypothetical protein [Lederbergia citrisecunda]MBS4198601.1 hypothetical protein [Lederbergia citrisecunda]